MVSNPSPELAPVMANRHSAEIKALGDFLCRGITAEGTPGRLPRDYLCQYRGGQGA